MVYQLQNGKSVKIPDEEIKKSMQKLELTKIQAIELWLEDNDYLINEEQEELQKKASAVKIEHGVASVREKTAEPKKRTVKISSEKNQLFTDIKDFLQQKYSINVVIDNKKLEIHINGKCFTLDLIENRQKKDKK